jgi:hypothetical protein
MRRRRDRKSRRRAVHRSLGLAARDWSGPEDFWSSPADERTKGAKHADTRARKEGRPGTPRAAG